MKSPYDIRVKLVVTAVLVVVLAGVAINWPGPHAKAAPAGDCPSSSLQIREMERFGEVDVYYMHWRHSDPHWSTVFKTFRDAPTKLEIDKEGATMCAAVDELYYAVMEFPLKADDGH